MRDAPVVPQAGLGEDVALLAVAVDEHVERGVADPPGVRVIENHGGPAQDQVVLLLPGLRLHL
eukprot:2346422-Lingulodinium_polyedra.AAC.1